MDTGSHAAAAEAVGQTLDVPAAALPAWRTPSLLFLLAGQFV